MRYVEEPSLQKNAEFGGTKRNKDFGRHEHIVQVVGSTRGREVQLFLYK